MPPASILDPAPWIHSKSVQQQEVSPPLQPSLQEECVTVEKAQATGRAQEKVISPMRDFSSLQGS